jgi:hypothetical protein
MLLRYIICKSPLLRSLACLAHAKKLHTITVMGRVFEAETRYTTAFATETFKIDLKNKLSKMDIRATYVESTSECVRDAGDPTDWHVKFHAVHKLAPAK